MPDDHHFVLVELAKPVRRARSSPNDLSPVQFDELVENQIEIIVVIGRSDAARLR